MQNYNDWLRRVENVIIGKKRLAKDLKMVIYSFQQKITHVGHLDVGRLYHPKGQLRVGQVELVSQTDTRTIPSLQYLNQNVLLKLGFPIALRQIRISSEIVFLEFVVWLKDSRY